MPAIYDRLRAALPAARFQPPATRAQIAGVEQALTVRFPDWLRDLYLHCDGIRPADSRGPFLYALERNDEFPETLLSWNQFHRSEWLNNLPDCKRFRPEIDWDKLGPQHLLIIGTDESVEWAIQPESGMQIICYDVRNPECLEVVGADLVQACLQRERFLHEIDEELFRGRELYRGEHDTSPASSDIDRLFDIIVALHKPHDTQLGIHVRTGWDLFRAISKRPGESGELFILPIGVNAEVRIATRGGNLPFAMRLTAWPFERDFQCVVAPLKDALMNILAATDAIRLPWVDGQRPRPDESTLRQIWRDVIGLSQPELIDMAEVLFARDDRRRVEDNESGTKSP